MMPTPVSCFCMCIIIVLPWKANSPAHKWLFFSPRGSVKSCTGFSRTRGDSSLTWEFFLSLKVLIDIPLELNALLLPAWMTTIVEMMPLHKHDVPEVFLSRWFQCTCLGRWQILQHSPRAFPSYVCGTIHPFSLESEHRQEVVRQKQWKRRTGSLWGCTPVWFQGISLSSFCPCHCQTRCWRVSAAGSRCCIIYQLMLSQECWTRMCGLPGVEPEEKQQRMV